MPRSQAARKAAADKAGPKKPAASTTPAAAAPRSTGQRRGRASTEFDSRSVKGQEREGEIALEGPAGIEMEQLEVVDGPNFKDRAEELNFMEEKLVIIIHADPSPKPEDPVYIGVNGRGCYVWRTKRTIIPRKYVERLARARADSVTQDVEAREPEAVNKLRIASNQRYPFSVLHDPSPKGSAWLQKVLTD